MSNPIKKFAAGAINIAIWENSGKEGNTFNTITIQRNYKDKKGEWKASNSLQVTDIPKAIAALQRTYDFLVVKDQTKESEKEPIIALA